MKTLNQTILSILCLQLFIGNMPASQAQVGLIKTGSRVSEQLESESSRTPSERKIDTAIEAEQYVRETMNQNELFSQQCSTKDGEIDESRAFTLSTHISDEDMQIKNCAQERDKLYHMNKLSDELIAEYNIDIETPNCSQCSIAHHESLKEDSDATPPGEACSLADQMKFKKEPCNNYCLWKPAIAAATTGMGTLLVNAFTKGNDGCPKTSMVGQVSSCAMNMVKGLLKGIWEAITGLTKLVWEGLKWCGEKVAQGAKWLFWDAWHKTEDKTATNIHAVSQADQKEVKDYEKDKEGWLKHKFNQVLDFIKELTYVGLFERESKCMNCAQKGQLMCEIGGRVASDVVGFTFTMGVGYGALKTAATKLGPKLAEVIAAASKTLPKVKLAGKSTALTKAMNVVQTKAKWVGKAVVKTTKPISKTVIKSWNTFKSGKVYAAIMKPKYSKVIDGIKLTGEAVSKSIPGKVVISTARGAKDAFGKYLAFDNRIMGAGAVTGANLLSSAGIGMSEFQIARMSAKLTEVAGASKAGITFDKKGNQVMRVPTTTLSSEQIAQFNRAGVSLTEVSSDGETILRMSRKTFRDLKDGKFATRYSEELGVPISKDGTVVIKQGSQVTEKAVKSLTLDEVSKLRDQGAVFTTKEHPQAFKVLDPNHLQSTGIKVGEEGEIVVKNLETGTIQLLDASKVKPEEVKEWQKKGFPITNKMDSEWERPVSKLGVPEGDAINHTAAAKLQELRNSGKGEEASKIAMNDVEELHVIKPSEDIFGASQAAKDKLESLKKIQSKHLEGIEGSTAVETKYNPEKGLLEFETPDGVAQSISMKKSGNYVVESYQNGKMAIVKDIESGKIEIHDFTKPRSSKVTTLTKNDSKLMDEAMGKTINGKPANIAALDEVKTNLELNHENKFRIIEENGEKKIQLESAPECSPKTIEIGSGKAL